MAAAVIQGAAILSFMLGRARRKTKPSFAVNIAGIKPCRHQAVSQKSSSTMVSSLGRVRLTWRQTPCTGLSVKPGSGCCHDLWVDCQSAPDIYRHRCLVDAAACWAWSSFAALARRRS